MREVFVDSPEQLKALFAGHVEVEIQPAGQGRYRACPWRLRQRDQMLYHPALLQRSFDAVGVRVNLTSDTTTLEFEVDANVPGHPPVEPLPQWTFDLLVDGQFHQRITQPVSKSLLKFTGWPAGEHRFELYLYQISPILLLSVRIDDHASAQPWQDDRPRWLTYGSSITQSGQAAGPSETWPALVANQWSLNHTNLGYGGNATLDPIVARMIAQIPQDAMSICFSVNNHSGAYSRRTWAPAIIGFILTIRDQQPEVPILCTSPIWAPACETTAGKSQMTLVQMRRDIQGAVENLKAHGDKHLHYLSGLELFDDSQIQDMPDGLHPNRQGCHTLAQRYSQHAIPWLAAQANWPINTSASKLPLPANLNS